MPRRRSGKKIDFVHWATANAFFEALSAPQAATLFAAQHLSETLMRIRGEWVSNFDGLLTGAANSRVTCGIILVPEGTGSTVLWSPETDGDAPWIWWDQINLAYEEYITDVVWSDVTASGRRVIDSKAMRIVRNQEIQCVVEKTNLVASFTANVMLGVRVLSGT